MIYQFYILPRLGIVEHLAHLAVKNISQIHLLAWSIQSKFRNHISVYISILSKTQEKNSRYYK